MLFDPDRHEPLRATAWDETAVREAVRAIVRDIEDHRGADGHWPVHPLDADVDMPRTGFKGLYFGSAGVLWALWTLQREGAVTLRIDPQAGIEQADAAYLADPDTGSVVPSYYLGEVGILLVRWRLTGARAVADRLHATIRSNIPNPTHEALWAAPGTMVAAWHLWEATREERWRELFLENVDQLWQTWTFDDAAQCHLWTQDLYGQVEQYFGAGHGFAGNAYPLLKGASLLDAARRDALHERCVQAVQALALVEDGAVNWPVGICTSKPAPPKLLMQWCHGAPGFVTALADFPARLPGPMDAMLTGAGEAVWRAGPLAKGYGLCHGTAGNGYALLKLYQRTGDRQWLDRARAFAMHAIAQHAQMRQQHGHARSTLWTGDAGLAVYLWHCLDGRADLPALDIV